MKVWTLLFTLVFIACSVGIALGNTEQDDDDWGEPVSKTKLGGFPILGDFYDFMLNYDDIETISWLMLKSGFAVELIYKQPFTLLAPNEDAFMNISLTPFKYSYNRDILRNLLAYHVLPGALSNETIIQGGTQNLETLNGEEITVQVDGSSISIVSAATVPAEVVEVDIAIDKSLIHIIDNILIPPNFPASDLVTLAEGAGLTELVNALKLTNLADTLSGLTRRGFTVLAPTNDAFETLGLELGVLRDNNETFITDALFTDLGSETLTSVLLGHVISGVYKENYIRTRLSYECSTWIFFKYFCVYFNRFSTLNKSKVKFDDVDGDLFVLFGSSYQETSKIALTDARAFNGVAHVIETVIVPDDLE